MDLGIKDKIAVVTGGGSGSGKAAALLFAQEGCKVAICGRTLSKLEAVRDEAIAAGIDGDRFFVFAADLGTPDDPYKFADAVSEKFGGIDIWFNNAGVSCFGTIRSLTEEQWHDVFEKDLMSVWRCTKAALPYMKGRKDCVFLNHGSFQSRMTGIDRYAYGAIKAAEESMTRTGAAYLGVEGIRMNNMVSGTFMSDRTKDMIANIPASMVDPVALHRAASAEEIADVAVFLCSPRSGYITGQSIPVCGGMFLCHPNMPSSK